MASSRAVLQANEYGHLQGMRWRSPIDGRCGGFLTFPENNSKLFIFVGRAPSCPTVRIFCWARCAQPTRIRQTTIQKPPCASRGTVKPHPTGIPFAQNPKTKIQKLSFRDQVSEIKALADTRHEVVEGGSMSSTLWQTKNRGNLSSGTSEK